MKQKKNKPKERKIGKAVTEKKPLIDQKIKNSFWTIVVVVVLVIFFIINNTRSEPEQGSYPPNYSPVQNESLGINEN